MKKPFVLICSVWLLFLANSCNLESFDFDKLSDEVNLNPEMVAPIAKAHISVWDLLQSVNRDNKDLIAKDPNGLIKIMYKKTDLYKYNVRDLLSFPVQQSFSSGDKLLGDIQPGNVSISRSITLADLGGLTGGGPIDVGIFHGLTVPFPSYSFNGPAYSYKIAQIPDFTSVTLTKGSLEITLENKLKVAVSFKGSLWDLGYNRKIKDDIVFNNIAPNATSKVTLDLAGIQLSNNVEFRLMSFSTPGSTTPVYIDRLDCLKLNIDLKNASISKGNLKIPPQTMLGSSGTVNFVFPEPDLKAYATVLKKGTMSIKISNTSKVNGSINLTLPEVKKNGIPVTASVPLSGNSVTIDLAGANLNFASDPIVSYNRVPYSYNIQVISSTGYVDYVSTDVIKLDMTITSLEFKSVHGDFGKRSIQIDPNKFDLNVDMLDNIDSNFKLANPKLELIFHNSIGMPASLALGLTASNKLGQKVVLTRTPSSFDIPVPANINAGTATGSMVFDRQNSNIVNFVALPPSGQISYSGKADFNKSNVVTPQNPNFLDLDAAFSIDLAMELPIELQISNMSFKDTSSISGEDYDQVESAELIINAKNGIPLDVDVQLFFLDGSNKQIGSSKKAKILSAAQVSSSGVITPTQTSQSFGLDASEMNNLRKAKGIVFSGTISSPSGGTGVASLYSDSMIDLNVVIKAKVNL
ncbi:MAG TPA: hypothetical protein DCR40_18515 [Prolixibacteraceae bacterium]|nr:hypothetical protein [Prolixibacteraceae bacterium]